MEFTDYKGSGNSRAAGRAVGERSRSLGWQPVECRREPQFEADVPTDLVLGHQRSAWRRLWLRQAGLLSEDRTGRQPVAGGARVVLPASWAGTNTPLAHAPVRRWFLESSAYQKRFQTWRSSAQWHRHRC